jgi:hypothetical protein
MCLVGSSIAEAARLLDAEWGRLTGRMAELQGQVAALTQEQEQVRVELSRVTSALRELRAPSQLLPEAKDDPLVLKLTEGMGAAGGSTAAALFALFMMWSEVQTAKSVREAVQELMEAADRTWASAEILEVLQRQPHLTRATNLPGAVRNAVWQLRQAGVVISEADGRVVATKWPGYVASRMPDEPQVVIRPPQTLPVGAATPLHSGRMIAATTEAKT